MLYYLFTYLKEHYSFPGAGLFQYISFRASMSVITSLFISLFIGKSLINFLARKQVRETVRDLALQGQKEKQGTPTMGGLIILASILIPVLLFAKLDNVYIILILISTVWLGLMGFIDDYIKLVNSPSFIVDRKLLSTNNEQRSTKHRGLEGKFKIIGQVGIGLIVGIAMYFNKNVVIKEKTNLMYDVRSTMIVDSSSLIVDRTTNNYKRSTNFDLNLKSKIVNLKSERSTKTTIPFIKNNEFDYSILLSWLPKLVDSYSLIVDRITNNYKRLTKSAQCTVHSSQLLSTEHRALSTPEPLNYRKYTWGIFIPIVVLIVAAVSNGANLTDGMDGLATGVASIIGLTLGILAWVSGNIVFANYLNIMYIPNIGELTIYISAFVGACIGFLWYNSYPAQVFMGDTGSLALGGIIAVFAIMIRKELLIPLLCGIFLIENLSVIIQVAYFKHTKKKFGVGKRIFKMSPLHHHFQLAGYHEAKIVLRFMIIEIMLAVLTVVTLKLR